MPRRLLLTPPLVLTGTPLTRTAAACTQSVGSGNLFRHPPTALAGLSTMAVAPPKAYFRSRQRTSPSSLTFQTPAATTTTATGALVASPSA